MSIIFIFIFILLFFELTNQTFSRAKSNNKNLNLNRNKHQNLYKLRLKANHRMHSKSVMGEEQLVQPELEMDPLIAANKRSDTFEEYEKADAMEEVYYRDTCCIVKDTESCKLDCVDDHCYKGRIEMVYMGFFGFIEGECPNFAHKWKCVKEIHGIVGDNELYPCKDKPECEIAAEADKFLSVDWTTNVVNGQWSPQLNHHPLLNNCHLVEPKKMAIIAACKCLNPYKMQEFHDIPQIPLAIRQSDQKQ